jgi:hypothetical protein
MDFTSFNLKHLERPDPLWLHKLGNALFFDAAKARAASEQKPLHEVTDILVRETGHHLRPSVPGTGALKGTPLDSLIEAVNAEAKALDDVFHLFPDREALRDKIAAEIFDVYERTGILQHLHTTGAITAEELRHGAALLIKQLDQYGANGLGPAWKHWQERGVDWIAHLENDTREFHPTRLNGITQSRPHAFKRGDYFKAELEAAGELDAVKFRDILTGTLGPAFEKAHAARESLIGTHLTSGVNQAGHDFFAGIAALHPNYERARKGTEKLHSQELHYLNDQLHPTEEQLARIRQGKTPQSFHEALSSISAEKVAEHPAITSELRESLAAGVRSTAAEPASGARSPAPGGAKASPLLGHEAPPVPAGITPHPEGASSSLEKAAETLSRKSGMVKVGTVILGGILCADQLRRAFKDHPDESGQENQSESVNKILHYVVAAAAASGVALVVLAKPETIGRFADRVTGLFRKSPQI